MRSSVLIGPALLAIPLSVGAHPHLRVEQQALLSIGRTRAAVTYYLAPSARDGAHMLDHADRDGNHQLSHSEQLLFANELTMQTAMIVDGQVVNLKVSHFAFPDRNAMISGSGVVRVKAAAPILLKANAHHKLSFRVSHKAYAERWLIQPFFFSDLEPARNQSEVLRYDQSNSVEVRF